MPDPTPQVPHSSMAETPRVPARSPDACATDATLLSGHTPGTPGPAAGRAFGRYVLLEELGRGGMGVVWRAYDTQLQREVALKQVLPESWPGQPASWPCQSTEDDPALADQQAGPASQQAGPASQQAGPARRFLREARLAARLRHPHIVAVHDVGEHEGQPYFTSEYIAGASLDKVMRAPVPERQALAWVEAMAEALAYAHAAGVIHRDVKPGNILIDANGEAFLADFGLAKEVRVGDWHDQLAGETAAAPLTQTGALVGTPMYMSPEQASGERDRVGPASDQFSLGSVLYHLLAGRPPFDGSGLREVLNAISERDPAPPRSVRPAVSRDAETTCLKALEKDPRHRYVDMAALAADLRRCLAGDPIDARPVPGVVRLLRQARRHARVAIPVSLALVLALGLAAWFGVTAWRRGGQLSDQQAGSASQQADSARKDEAFRRANLVQEERLAKSRRVGVVLERWGRLYPQIQGLDALAHSPRMEPIEKNRRVDAAWREVDRFQRETPSDATSQAVMWALSGWARALAGKEEEGIAWMRKASALEADVPYGPLMEALILFSRYVERQRLQAIGSSSAGMGIDKPAAETGELARLHAAVAPLLERARNATLWGPEASGGFQAAIDGIHRMQSADYAGAEASLSRALGSSELGVFETGLRFARARARLLQKDFAAAKEDLDEVSKSRPEDPNVPFTRGIVCGGEADEAARTGKDPRPALLAAISEYDRANGLDQDHLGAWLGRAAARWRLAETEGQRGADPRADFMRAVEDYDEVLARDPGDDTAHQGKGAALLLYGMADEARGHDARKKFEEAITELGAALARNPDLTDAYHDRGMALCQLAKSEAARGADPRERLAKAIQDFQAALARSPNGANAWMGIGDTRVEMGQWDESHGADPRDAYRSAIDAHAKATTLDPGLAPAHMGGAGAWSLLGDAEIAAGGDGEASLRKAMEGYAEALRLDPVLVDAHLGLGNIWKSLGRRKEGQGKDAGEEYRKAIGEFDEALKVNPEDPRLIYSRGAARIALGFSLENLGQDPRECYRGAIDDARAALDRNPSLLEAHVAQGKALGLLGAVERSRGAKWRELTERAIAEFEVVIAAEPDRCLLRGDIGKLMEMLDRIPEAERSYEEAISQFEAGHHQGREQHLVDLHFWLARCYALDSPDRAFQHLGAMIALGYRDANGLEKEPRLEPLRGDPRWTELLGRLRK